jgi:hypothetical protein
MMFLNAAIFLLPVASIGLLSASTSNAATPQQVWMLQNCANTPNDPCVKSLWVITKEGKRIEAKLTGRGAVGEGEELHKVSDEYSIEGMQFEYPASNLLVNRVFYDGVWIQTVVEASWLNNANVDFSLDLPYRKTNLFCGTSDNPLKCNRNVRFNQEFTIEQELRLPESFKLSFLNARSDYLRFETSSKAEVIGNLNYYSTKLFFNVTEKQQMLFAPLLPDPLASSDYADFVIDQSIVNLYTPESRDGQRLGKCSLIPSLSVVSNGINPQTPEWDPITQSLSVSIAGPHFKTDGTLNSGFFEARISRKLGECLWGIDLSKKIQAVITVTDNGGTPEVQTVASKMVGEDFILQAANFHYSTPRISLKLKNEQPSPAPVAIAVKKTITCVKGKMSKKVTSANPKCPAGYKKK